MRNLGMLWWGLCALGACGGSSSPAADAGPPDAMPVPPDAAPCAVLTDRASDVAEVGVAEVAPTPAGGTLVDGTYAVTAAVIYTGVGGQTGADGKVYHATTVDTGGEYQYVDLGSAAVATTGAYQTTTATADITVEQGCPTISTVPYTKYDASPTAFTLYDVSNPAAVLAVTFTMQP